MGSTVAVCIPASSAGIGASSVADCKVDPAKVEEMINFGAPPCAMRFAARQSREIAGVGKGRGGGGDRPR